MSRTLIECGWLVTMDPKLGEMENAELLFDGGEIVAIGHDLNATANDIIDASEMIVMPGLVNAHIHSWQAQLRGIGSEWMTPQYMKNIHSGLAMHYQADDNYIGNLVDDLATDDVRQFESQLIAHLRQQHADLLTEIRDSKDLSDELQEKLKAAVEGFKSTFRPA